MIMMVISVSSIFLVVLAVIPKFSNIEYRKYRMLSFFFELKNEIMKVCLDRSEVFE